MTPFEDLDAYQQLPRLHGLVLSPDGQRLVTGVSTPSADGTRFRQALWEIDPTGEQPARRLTRGAAGESAPVFTPDGDLLFTSARPDPAQPSPDADAPAALWRLPASGEAHVVGTRPGGIAAPATADDSDVLVVTSMTMPGATSGADDEKRRDARSERKVSAILHTGYPIRYWDHDLGPDQPRLLAGTLPAADGEPVEWRDLTPDAGAALVEAAYDLSADGSTVVTGWRVPVERGETRDQIVALDVATGERRFLLGSNTDTDTATAQFYGPRISPDGRWVVCVRETLSTPDTPPDVDLVVVPIGGGASQVLTAGWDRWPVEYRWSPDGAALLVTADDAGRSPVFRIARDGGEVVRLTGDDGAYSALRVAPDGSAVYALRSAVDAPPAPVRLDAFAADQTPTFLPGPAEPVTLPGTLTEVTATAEDGTPLRAWLVLPAGADEQTPAPLLLWIHGGPLGSWNAWQWRWNPWLMAAAGYAVLLPDPALSTGYGHDFITRGWGAWGAAPYTDLLALTDAAQERPDVDDDRTAAMGGSFGGYMANWVAGHTDRFRAIVTHASLWSLDRFGATTDDGTYWAREMTARMAEANSPDRSVAEIRTPMLVIHGDKDYRVPIGEALALWFDLVTTHDGDPAELPHRFLYFPDENHWILTPNNATVWYQTVLAFLAQHVLGQEWETPEGLD